MCKYTYTQHSCSCKHFLRSPQYCAAALASSSSPPQDPWIPLLSISETGYEDYNLILDYDGYIHLQAARFFKPALKCEKVELVREGEAQLCRFHGDHHLAVEARYEKKRLEREEGERKEREKEEKNKVWKLAKKAAKKVAHDALFGV